MTIYARGTNAWVGLAKADQKRVHKDPNVLIFAKEAPIFKPDQKWIDRPVMIPGASEPDGFRVPGMRSVAGTIPTELHPTNGLELLRSIFGDVTTVNIERVVKVVITNDPSSAN